MRHEHKGIDIEEVRTVQNRPTIIEINNNLLPGFLLGHSDKPLPEPLPGIGVALRQTIIYFDILRRESKNISVHGGDRK